MTLDGGAPSWLRAPPVRALVAGLALAGGPASARADEPIQRLTFAAGVVEADPTLREVVLRDGVVVKAGRYRLEATELRLTFVPGGVDLDGRGRVALCPCAAPPVAIGFSGATLRESGDLTVSWPRLELFGVPVLTAPWLWLRTPDHPGLLPPLLALRGDDGLLVGGGGHLPWVGSDGGRHALDVTAGAYAEGGAEVTSRLTTPSSTTGVAWDAIHGTRLSVDARGSLPPAGAGVAWEADAVRGDRGRSGTIDLGPAALPFDTAAVETSLRGGGAGTPGGVSAGVVGRAVRGVGPLAAGPYAAAALGGPLGLRSTWGASGTGYLLGGSPETARPLATATAEGETGARAGAFDVAGSVRARAQAAGETSTSPGSGSEDAIVAGRLELGLPLARRFASASASAPLTHRLTPFAELGGAVGARQGAFFDPLYGPLPLASGLADAGVTTTLSRPGGVALRLEGAAGALATSDAPLRATPAGTASLPAATGAPALRAGARPLAHARLALESTRLAGSAEVGALGGGSAGAAGAALLGRVRVGAEESAFVRAAVAGLSGDDPRAARAVADRSAAGLPGGELGYLSTDGWTGSAEVSIPWWSVLRTSVRADVDLVAGDLLGLGGFAAYRHPCGCLALALFAGHRTGRGGIDAMATVDLSPR